MKRILQMLLGALAMLVGVELLLQALPVSTSTQTGYHVHPNILTNPPHHRWTMATGWDLRDVQHMHANNYGFAAEHDFKRDSHAIGLVGDSYVEASMLPLEDRPAAQLERSLGASRPVYALGSPGTSLLDYVERMRWAYQTLGIRQFVVMMESTDASQTRCDSGNVHARCIDPDTLAPVIQRLPPPGVLKRIVRESALAQYLNSQLKFSATRLFSPEFWRSGAPDHAGGPHMTVKSFAVAATQIEPKKLAVIDAAVDTFLRDMEELEGLRVVFVIDMNRRNLSSRAQRPDEGYHVSQRLRAHDFTVVHGEPLYREHLHRSQLRLDVGPHDGHLNAIGVGLLMAAAAHAIQQRSTNRTDDRGN